MCGALWDIFSIQMNSFVLWVPLFVLCRPQRGIGTDVCSLYEQGAGGVRGDIRECVWCSHGVIKDQRCVLWPW